MEAHVKKWGNSLGIRIPQSFAIQIGIQENSIVDLHLKSGELVISPRSQKYSLIDLLNKVTSENVHSETDWGPTVGKEQW
ncbi:AbrB/MazE/SpoVT family DNA-binding domain-containing protein [soil metagenome]